MSGEGEALAILPMQLQVGAEENEDPGDGPTRMAKSRPQKKREPAAPATSRILPMQLRIGDRLVDETGEWEVVSQPYTTAGRKNARVRVQRVGEHLRVIHRQLMTIRRFVRRGGRKSRPNF